MLLSNGEIHPRLAGALLSRQPIPFGQTAGLEELFNQPQDPTVRDALDNQGEELVGQARSPTLFEDLEDEYYTLTLKEE